VVWRLDRLTRSVADLYALLSVFEQSGCTFKSITEPFETRSAVGKLFITLIAAMAQWERENLIERVQLGQMHQATQTDHWTGGRAPYGYILRGKHLVVDEEAAAVVRRIYEALFREGNVYAIMRQLNEEGVAAPGARGWTATTIRYILMNPVYAGIRSWKRHARPEGGKGAYRRLPRDAWLVVDDHGPPAIVATQTWERAYRTLNRPSRLSRSRGRGEHPLTGVLVCATCGSKMNGKSVRRMGCTWRYYRCPGRYQRGTCPRGQVRADDLEALVLGAVRATFDEHTLLQQAVLENQGTEIGAEHRRLTLRLESIGRRIRRWEDAYEDDSIDLPTLRQRLSDLRIEERDVLRQLNTLWAVGDAPGTELPLEGWTVMTAAERLAFIQALIARVCLHLNGTVDIEWK
jgi:site-specific DNA recombinase